MLRLRIQDTLVQHQSHDQAAYREIFCAEDHVLTTTLLMEACNGWNADLWMGLVDFEAAFDTIEHVKLWQVFARQGVDDRYIYILKTLYTSQRATVMLDVECREFSLARGVKQMDSISAMFFIAVMEEK